MNSNKNFVNMLKRIWKRLVLHGVRYSNNYKKIDAIYLIDDPWGMASASEKHRFAETNRLILENFGHVGTVLEIGCGEGHQSLFLQQVCDRLIGLDVSARAVERAQRRCPQGEFLVGDIFSQDLRMHTPFDLVVASEVLYYMQGIPAILRKMRAIGRNNIVTYFAGEMENLDPQILSQPGVESEILAFNQIKWRAVWWHGDNV